ncbi:MAG: DUF479 domain-containing protein [Flavobacteriales bacterium]|nr:DUF479 domain-containing protein [Flavobacteriales bacterium]
MNFLGHLVLSGDDPLTITGNFMADAVKGRDLSAYEPRLRAGITLHRTIDHYTDNHPLTLQGRQRLRDHCGKYAGVALDLFYDHCIAITWREHMPGTLDDFVQRMHALLTSHAHLMPERTRSMLPYMVQGDWLLSYRDLSGIGRALNGLARRVPAGEVLIGAEAILAEHLGAYIAESSSFLRALRTHLERGNG